MTPEEYERIKEAEKEHLRAMKKLKRAVRELERSKAIASSVTKMSASSQTALETHEEMVDRLAMETARYEAQLEVALESSGEKPVALTPDKTEEEYQKLRAQDLVQQIKSQLEEDQGGVHETTRETTATKKPESPAEGSEEPEKASLPEKTIGRMRSERPD